MSRVITKADLVKSVNGEITKVYPNTLADNVKFDVDSTASVKDKIKEIESLAINTDNRISNLLRTPTTEVTEEEIDDARTTTSGTKYSTLGDAIRSQIKDINDEMDRRFYRGPLLRYKIETKIGSAIDANAKYFDTNPNGIDNTRACSPTFYPTYSASSIHLIIEEGFEVYVVQYEDKVESGRRAGSFISGDIQYSLNSNTKYIRIISRKVDRTDIEVIPEVYVVINSDVDYVTPQMYKYSDNSWDEAFELAMDTGKLIFIPEGIYQLEGSIDINKNGVSIVGSGYNTIICPPRCFNDNTDANHDEFGNTITVQRTIPSDAFKYTYAFKVGGVTGVTLSNFRIRAQYEEESTTRRQYDSLGNDIGPLIDIKGTRGCGIITTKSDNTGPSRNFYTNLWIEGCLIGIVQRSIGCFFDNVVVQGLMQFSDFRREWKNWYKNYNTNGIDDPEPVKYDTLWQHIGVITTGTDSFWSNCAILWNDIGLYCYSGGYFTNVKCLANRYNCIIGQRNNSYGNDLVTDQNGNPLGNKTCLSVKMSNCYFQEAKCSNLLINNAMSCSIEATVEAPGDTYHPAMYKNTDYTKDDYKSLPITNLYIYNMAFCDLNITTKLGSSGGYERYLLYCASSRIGFNNIKCYVTGPSSPFGHKFEMFGGNVFALLPSDIYINNINMRDMGIFDETYFNSASVIENFNRLNIIPYTSYYNNELKSSAIKISISNAQVGDIIALKLGECTKFGGRFIVESDQLISGLKMSVNVGKIVNNNVYLIDGQAELFASGIGDNNYGTQTQVYYGRNMQSIANYVLCLKITNLPDINYGDNVEFKIYDFTYGLEK